MKNEWHHANLVRTMFFLCAYFKVRCKLRLTAAFAIARNGMVRGMRYGTGGRRGGALVGVTLAAIVTLCLPITFGQRRAQQPEIPMADKRWVSTDGNLATAASYAPSGVPFANDSLYFDGSSNIDVSSGLTTTFFSTQLTRTWVQAPYQGDIGAEGNAFTLPCTQLIHNGSGSLYHDALTTTPHYSVVIDSPNQQDAYTLVGTDGAGGVTLDVACISGGVRILGSTTVLRRLLVGNGRNSSLPIVTIEAISACLTMYQSGGYVTTKKGLGLDFGGNTGRAIIDGGTLIYDALGTSGWNVVEIAGGRMEYNGTGTMTSCIVSSGTLDMTKDSRAKTIATLILMPGANFHTHKNITVSSFTDLRGPYPILNGTLP
jgi:hypothetical protein